jgi:hypothetical protein
MFKLRTALDEKKETLQTIVSSPVIEEIDTLDWCREVYCALARLDTFVDPVLMCTVGEIANILSRLALRVESEDIHVWTDFVSLLTNSMWSPTSFALFIVYCRARTTCESLHESNDDADFDLIFGQLRQCVGIKDAGCELTRLVRFVTVRIDAEKVSGSTWFNPDGVMKREGMRILEKGWILQLTLQATLEEVAHYTEELPGDELLSEDLLAAWSQNCLDNTMGSDILNVIDQWCTIFSLKPLDIWIAGGERGCCPNDMLNDIPGWIMRSVQGNKLPASSMTHVQCLLCFGILMRQRFSFDWFRLCFLSAINPLQKLHVLRLYRKGPDMKPPPIVLQMDIDHYIVALKNPFVCITLQGPNSGYRAVDVWCGMIKKYRNNLFSRKKNIHEIITRIKND